VENSRAIPWGNEFTLGLMKSAGAFASKKLIFLYPDRDTPFHGLMSFVFALVLLSGPNCAGILFAVLSE
jgi:hypothetical protein